MKYRLLVVFLVLLLTACSSGSDEKDKTGTVKQATDKVAREVVESIQRPINKAQAAKSLGDARAEKLKEYAEEQQ